MTFFKSQYLLAATLVAPLFSFATEASAQTAKRFVVKGVVVDATTKEGEQYATMKITSQTDSTSTAALAILNSYIQTQEAIKKCLLSAFLMLWGRI